MRNGDETAPTGDIFRIFLSSTAEDLEPFRKKVRTALEKLRNVKLVTQETFGAVGGNTVAECRRMATESDVVVAVIAHRYGWVPTVEEGGDGQLSITALEVEAALNSEPPIPVLAFLVDEEHPWTAPKEQDRIVEADGNEAVLEISRRIRLLKELKERLSASIRDTFTTPDDLATYVTTSVVNEIGKIGAQRTKTRIDSGIAREKAPRRSLPVRASKFVNPPPMSAPAWFQDRHVETQLIAKFLRDEGRRVMTVVGRGGVGKTAMVCRLLKALESGRLPDDLGEFEVDGIVYLSPVGRHHVTYHNFVADLASLLDPEHSKQIMSLYAQDSHNPAHLMLTLLEEFSGRPVVVLLDNFESQMDSTTDLIVDESLRDALLALRGAAQHSVKVLITSRIVPIELDEGDDGIRHKLLRLDEGLPSPDAEQVLRALDTDGTAGLADASDAELLAAQERTRGFPRALEALYAILETDPATDLTRLLDHAAEAPPERVVEVLVGQAFDRLDSESQQIMQAVAVYPTPVSPVAVDYLLQPDEPAINSGPVLQRLARRHLVRTDAGRYYLHPIDRAYALSQLAIADEEGDGNRQVALAARAADYYEQIRTEPTTWESIDDLEPQLAEFELRCRAGDYYTANSILTDIAPEYLARWGHRRLVIELYQQVYGQLTDPISNAVVLAALGESHDWIGKHTEAIGYHSEFLSMTRRHRLVPMEVHALAAFGNSFMFIGDWGNATEYFEESVAVAGNVGMQTPAAVTGLGECRAAFGDYREAIDHTESALEDARRTSDREDEGILLANLGAFHVALGQYEKATAFSEQAMRITRQIGHTYGEALALTYLARGQLAQQQPAMARSSSEDAIAIADRTGESEPQAAARVELARALLAEGNPGRALLVATEAQVADHAIRRAEARLISGIASMLLNRTDEAQKSYREALDHADEQLALNTTPGALDTRALALCGLTIVGEERATEAKAAFQQARSLTTAAGVVQQTLTILDEIVRADTDGRLRGVRDAAMGAAPEGAT